VTVSPVAAVVGPPVHLIAALVIRDGGSAVSWRATTEDPEIPCAGVSVSARAATVVATSTATHTPPTPRRYLAVATSYLPRDAYLMQIA
jgi:hypothetical protein